MGFDNAYSGLKESEAWQRIYEFGKNLMPIKEHILQKKYNKIFNKKTKVIRDDAVCKVNTDRLVPGDIIILERGAFVPVDAKILEESALEFDIEFKPEDVNFKNEGNEKIIYQGMKVKKGKAIIEAIRTGEATYLGSIVKKIDNKKVCSSNFEKVIQIYFNIIGGLGIVLLLFGAIFSFVRGSGDIISRLSIAGYSGLLLFLATLPLGAILALGVKFIEQKRIIRKSNLVLKKYGSLLKAHKTTVICVDEKFLERNYEKYIQRFYSAGIMMAIISKKGLNEIKELAKSAGVFETDVEAISGNELASLKEEEFLQAICSTIIFYEINNEQKLKILEGFDKLNIKTISTINGIEDLPVLMHADVGICTHHKKKHLEYEFSDATVVGAELTSIYSLLKGSCMIKSYLNHYMKYYVMFQLPVIVSLLAALLVGVDLKVFYFQTLMFIIFIIPLLLLLINRDYSEALLVELKKKDKTFIMSCIKFGFLGLFISVISIGFYILLSSFGHQEVLKIGCITMLLTLIDATIIYLSRNKFTGHVEKRSDEKGIKEDVKEEKLKKEIKHEVKNEVKQEKKRERVKEKIKTPKIKNSKKSNIEDIRDEIM